MKPIEGYDLINESGDFKQLPKGIYLVRLTNIVDVPEKEYLEVYCDIAKGEYTNYFKKMVDSGLKDSSKTVRSYKQNALPFFKSFITAVEKSNPSYNWDWDETKLIGKFVIAVVSEEEYIDKEGNIKVITRINSFRSIEAAKAGNITVPECKKVTEEQLAAWRKEHETAETDSPITELNLDDLPF